MGRAATPPHTADSGRHKAGGVLLEVSLRKRLGEDVCSIFGRPNGCSFDDPHLLVVGEEVDTSIDMLCALARFEILGQVHARGVVNKDRCRHIGFCAQVAHEQSGGDHRGTTRASGIVFSFSRRQ